MRYQAPSSPRSDQASPAAEPFPRDLLRQATEELRLDRKKSDLAHWLQQQVPDPMGWRGELTRVWKEVYGNPAAGTLDWEAYVMGIEKLGSSASHLIPDVVEGACQPTTSASMSWTGMLATVTAGDRASLERILPVALSRRRIESWSGAEGATHYLCEKLSERLGERPLDRPWLCDTFRRSTAVGADDSSTRHLAAEVVLACLGDDHPNAQAYLRGVATGIREDGTLVGQSTNARADLVLAWCNHQVDRGRSELVAEDQALVASLTHLAFTGTMPRSFAAAVPHQQSAASALLGRVAGDRHG